MSKDESKNKEGWSSPRETQFTRMQKKTQDDMAKFADQKRDRAMDKVRHAISEENLEHFEKISMYDSVCEIYNHKAFMRKLENELKRAKRYKRPVSLLVLEVDDLDSYVKQYGTLIVDEVLKSLVGIVQKAIRDVDVPGRLQDNRLAVIFPETYSSRAIVVGERIREMLRGKSVSKDLKHLRLTVSVGIVSFPTHGRDEHDLMKMAFQFMAAAQEQGGDAVHNG
ncbi:MAG: GGDEF domain-containing protein [Cyanobacteria bacterium TGS_CYA1]|nr:GGDEF domain-containing protein [Cyanobacteria bacterium TGS_CYA1]MDX2105416.1 GGDEF domain-containing protein [Candidatus Melainabacteria bacterium]